jgi:hypothetical protein
MLFRSDYSAAVTSACASADAELFTAQEVLAAAKRVWGVANEVEVTAVTDSGDLLDVMNSLQCCHDPFCGGLLGCCGWM